MTTAVGPPQATPPTVRGALSTLPTFVRHNLPVVLASAIVAGIIGWVVNVWLLAVKFEGNNDVPTGSPVSGGNNTGSAVVFWVLFSMVLFGAVGYARAVGLRRFMYDLRTTPRVLIGFMRSDGAAARVHLLWGAAVALLIGLAVPPAIGAVVSVGVLATLPTVLGSILGSVLGRVFNGVLKPFRPGTRPMGIEAVIVGLLGAGLALAVGFLVPEKGIRAAVAAVCIVAALVLAQQMKPASAAAVVGVAVAGCVVLRWLLAARHAYADDGGFAECGFKFDTWWRQCDGAGAVRRQAVPGGVASAAGAPVGVFLGQWAGSLARLRPVLFPTTPAPLPAQPLLPPWLLPDVRAAVREDQRRRWVQRGRPWEPGPDLAIPFPDGRSLHCATNAGGEITTPWVVRGGAAPPIDPVAAGRSFDWQPAPHAPAPTADPAGSAGAAGSAEALARRMNDLHASAPTRAHLADVHRCFHDAAAQPLDRTLHRLAELEAGHDAHWAQRLSEAVARHQVPGAHDTVVPVASDVARAHVASAGSASDRLESAAAHETSQTRSLYRIAGNAGPPAGDDQPGAAHDVHRADGESTRVQEMKATTFTTQRAMALEGSMAGRPGIAATGHASGLPQHLTDDGRTAMHGGRGVGFTGDEGLHLGAQRAGLPLPAGPQLVDAGTGHALVTGRELGAAHDVPGGAGGAQHTASVAGGDRLGAAAVERNQAAHRFDVMMAQTRQLQAIDQQMHGMDATITAMRGAPDLTPAALDRQQQAMLAELQRMHTVQQAQVAQAHDMEVARAGSAAAPAMRSQAEQASVEVQRQLQQMEAMQAQVRRMEEVMRAMPHAAGSTAAPGATEAAMHQQLDAMQARMHELAGHQRSIVDAQRIEMMQAANDAMHRLSDARAVAMGTPWRVADLSAISGVAPGSALPPPSGLPSLHADLHRLHVAAAQLVELGAPAGAVDRVVEMRHLMEAVGNDRLRLADAQAAAHHRFGADLGGLAPQAETAARRQAMQEATNG